MKLLRMARGGWGRRAGRGGVRALWWAAPLAGLAALLLALALGPGGPAPLRRQACWPLLWDYDEALDLADDFEGFDNETGVFSSAHGGAPVLVVPNIVHFLRLGAAAAEFSLVEYVCAVAAWRRQRPDWLMLHTDRADFRGALWRRLLAEPGLRDALQIVPAQREDGVDGILGWPHDAGEHAADVVARRLRILRKYGGIFLDNDAYLLRSLDPLRRYEMSVAWPEGGLVGAQVLVAHPSARLLSLWLESYRGAFAAALPGYNAARRPTLLALHARPELAHRERFRLGPGGSDDDNDYSDDDDMKRVLFLERDLDGLLGGDRLVATGLAAQPRARSALAAEALLRRGLRYPAALDEGSVCDYNVTLLQLAQAALPGLCDHAPAG